MLAPALVGFSERPELPEVGESRLLLASLDQIPGAGAQWKTSGIGTADLLLRQYVQPFADNDIVRDRREDHDVFAPVCGRFTEGSDTPDLKETKGLLDELT